MTTSFAPGQLWRTMPGWGITANLLPPEIVTARRTRVLRKWVLSAIVLVLLIGTAGYVYALSQKDDANSQMQAEQAKTAALHAAQAKYSEVVSITADVAGVASQLTQVLAPDVDMKALLGQIMSPAPGGGISQVEVDVAAPSTAGASVSTGASVLDSSGRVHVGTVSITGQAANLAQVAAYVVKLSHVPGVVTAYPSSLASDAKSVVTYTIQLTLTDQVFSHHYDNLASTPGALGGK